MSRSILCAALLSAAALTSGNVHAQTVEAAQRAVSAKGVNFEDMKQVRFFYAKLTWAAHDVCASEVSDPLTQMADKFCQDEALGSAVSQVDKPLLNRITGHRRVELITGQPAGTLAMAGHANQALVVTDMDAGQ